MHIVYIDESKTTEGGKFYAYSALCIHEDVWKETFDKIKAYRKHLKDTYGIFVRKELHAWKFVAGKGQIANRPIYKEERGIIFRETIDFISKLDVDNKKVCLFNSVEFNQFYAIERIVTRIHNTMKAWDSKAILLFDEGEEVRITALLRKMSVFNPIPSKYGVWRDTGQATRNVATSRILEDALFKNSEQSYFIQLVDFVAFALMRRERQIASKNALGIHDCFPILDPICLKSANIKDPLGVVRSYR